MRNICIRKRHRNIFDPVPFDTCVQRPIFRKFFQEMIKNSYSSGVAVPITALGAAGAAIGLVPKMVSGGLASGNDVAVFTAMCMCWSGYLSTHVAMMDTLGCSRLTGKALLSHTIGGLCSGITAHWIYILVRMMI